MIATNAATKRECAMTDAISSLTINARKETILGGNPPVSEPSLNSLGLNPWSDRLAIGHAAAHETGNAPGLGWRRLRPVISGADAKQLSDRAQQGFSSTWLKHQARTQESTSFCAPLRALTRPARALARPARALSAPPARPLGAQARLATTKRDRRRSCRRDRSAPSSTPDPKPPPAVPSAPSINEKVGLNTLLHRSKTIDTLI